MRSHLFLAFVAAAIVAEAHVKQGIINAKVDTKAAPWWDALRAESYYRQCHSSCTEYSKGTKTTVELCDDTQVTILLS